VRETHAAAAAAAAGAGADCFEWREKRWMVILEYLLRAFCGVSKVT
jgi:hypothetical protein